MIGVLVRARLNRAGGYTELAIRQYQGLSDELSAAACTGTALLPALPELIDILARTGQLTEARTLLPRLRAEGARFSFPQQRAALEHCEAVTVDTDRIDSAFGRALEARDASPNSLARSHTLLAWGERLRRARRPRDARAPLLEALDGFEQMGSAPWARAARRQPLRVGCLDATSSRVYGEPHPSGTGSDTLRCQRRKHQRDRRRPVRQPQDCRGPSHEGLPQA